MKNTQIDIMLRKAFSLGEQFNSEQVALDLNAAHGTWADFEELVSDAMMDENGDTNVIDDEAVRRARYG